MLRPNSLQYLLRLNQAPEQILADIDGREVRNEVDWVAADHERGQHDERKCRHDAPCAPREEVRQGERVPRDLLVQERGDQESRDDEEDIDADETPGDLRGRRMEGDDGKHGDGAQAVDMGQIGEAPLVLRSLSCGIFQCCSGRAALGNF
jgi:hypothetical protein